MAITLSLDFSERGDNLVLTLTDTSGTATGGWDGTPAVTDINNSTNALTLDIAVTTSDGVVASYGTIDLYTEFGPFTTTADLVFDLDMHMLVDGVTTYTALDEFPDGLYEITYKYQGANPTVYHILIDGQVKTGVYDLIRTIPTKYQCDDPHDRDILDIIFIKGYYDSMIATALVGREDQVIEQLSILQRLVTNGSNYSW
jgi:hypothetical protein